MKRFAWFFVFLLPCAALALVLLILSQMLWIWIITHVSVIHTDFAWELYDWAVVILAVFMTVYLSFVWSGAIARRSRERDDVAHEHRSTWVRHEQERSREDLENALADRTRRAANLGRDHADIARDFSDYLKKRRGG